MNHSRHTGIYSGTGERTSRRYQQLVGGYQKLSLCLSRGNRTSDRENLGIHRVNRGGHKLDMLLTHADLRVHNPILNIDRHKTKDGI